MKNFPNIRQVSVKMGGAGEVSQDKIDKVEWLRAFGIFSKKELRILKLTPHLKNHPSNRYLQGQEMRLRKAAHSSPKKY